MKKLFLLSIALMVYTNVVVILIFLSGLAGLIQYRSKWEFFLAVLLIIIAGAGAIMLGVMLVTHVRDMFKG